MTLHRYEYGRRLEDFEVGASYAHPWEVTIDGGTIAFFQASFLDATPTYASAAFARAMGLRDRAVHPLLLLNLGLSFSVMDVSEQAIAHLAYLDVRFPNACYPGATVRATSTVLGVKPTSAGDRGVVHVRTVVVDDHERPVCVFERKALVRGGGKLATRPTTTVSMNPSRPFDHPRWPAELAIDAAPTLRRVALPGHFESFEEGDVFAHQVGKTIGESEHMQLTALVRNTHPLHFDEQYCQAGQSFAKTRVVYGGLVFAWTAALASRDVAGHALWDLGFDAGAHPSGVVAGDTLYAASKVLAARAINAHFGEVELRLVGVKNVRAEVAAERYGDALFMAELEKRDTATKVPEKVFEITRRLLVRKG